VFRSEILLESVLRGGGGGESLEMYLLPHNNYNHISPGGAATLALHYINIRRSMPKEDKISCRDYQRDLAL